MLEINVNIHYISIFSVFEYVILHACDNNISIFIVYFLIIN